MASQQNMPLHDLAVRASGDLHMLATGLAHAGADPAAVQKLNQFAAGLGQLANGLNQAPEVEAAAKNGPGTQAPGQPPVGHPGPGLAPGAPGGPPSSGAFGPASQALQQQMAAAAAARH